MNPNFRPPIIPNPNQGFFFRPPPNVPNQPPVGVNVALPLQRPNLPPPPGANLPPPPRPNFPLHPPVANLPPPSIPKLTSISTPPVQIIDEVLPVASSSPAASSPSNNNRPMAQIMGKEQSTSQKTTKPPSDRQFGFSKPTPTQINAQIGEIKQKFGEYSIAECREKVDWLSSLCIQQQLDLDLLHSAAWTVEDWTSRELRKFGKIRKDNGILTSQKKKLQETDRKNQKEIADLRTKMSTEKAEFEAKIEKLESEMRLNATNFQMTKNSLEKEVNDLKPFKEKWKKLTLEAETLKSENTKMKKDLDGLMAEKERYGKMVDPNKLEDALRERDESRKKCAELKQERATWKEKVDKLEKKLTAEIQKKKEQKSKTPEGGEEDEEEEEKEDRKVKLAAKDAEIAKLREELAEKDDELQKGKNEAKHKYFQLKEKLQKKRADCEKLKEDCRKEQEYREKAELEAEKANKELAKLRKKMEEMKQQRSPTPQKEEQKILETTTTEKLENKKLLLESLQKRVQECAAKKAEMEKVISPLLAKMAEGKCENCVKYEEYFNRTQQRNSELTAQVFTKNMEIAELRGRVKEKENSNDGGGENLDGTQKQQRMAPKNGQLGGIQQQSRGHKRKAGDGQEKEGNDPPVVAQKQQKSISAASILLLDTELEQNGEKQQQQGKEPSKSPNLAETQISPSLPAAAPNLVNSSSSVILLSVNTSTPPPTSLLNQSIVGQQSPNNNAFGRSISQQPLTKTAQHPNNASYRPSSVPNDQNTSPMLKRVQTSHQIARTSPHLNRQQIKEPLMDMDEPASAEEETADQPSAQLQQQQHDDGGNANSDAQDQIKTMAARIVTNFLLFLGQPQNIQRNARALIPEFIQLHNLPSMQLISDQLALIADEAERGKAERARLANANNNRGA